MGNEQASRFKIVGDAALRLAVDNWYWGRGSQELLGVTLADFKANPTLVASEAHHVVLKSAPESGTQRFPLRLGAKIYKFCIDRQDEGTDKISLLDAADNEVFSLNQCEYCNLAGVDLSGLDLSGQGGVKLQHTDLSGATINNTNLSGAGLRFAILQRANLSRSNLETANLCSAQLNGSVALANAADLFGAHLKNGTDVGAIGYRIGGHRRRV